MFITRTCLHDATTRAWEPSSSVGNSGSEVGNDNDNVVNSNDMVEKTDRCCPDSWQLGCINTATDSNMHNPWHAKWCSAKPRHRFALQWLDNVKVHKFTKYEVNIPRGSRVKSILTKELDWPKWCSTKSCHCCAWQWLNNVKLHKYTKFGSNISGVEEIWAFSLKELD